MRTDAMMYGTFRCPVCGHREGTELESATGVRVVECEHCRTELEVQGRGRDSARFTAQVFEGRRQP